MHTLAFAATLAANTEPQPLDTLADGVVKPALILLYIVYAIWMFVAQLRKAQSNNWSGKSDIVLRHLGFWALWMLVFGLSLVFLTHDWIKGIDTNVSGWWLPVYFWWWILSPIAFVAGPAMMTYNKGHGSHAMTKFWRRFWQFMFVCSGWWLGAFLNFIAIFY